MSPLLPGETLGQGHRGFRQRVFKWVASFWSAVTNPACCEKKSKSPGGVEFKWQAEAARGPVKAISAPPSINHQYISAWTSRYYSLTISVEMEFTESYTAAKWIVFYYVELRFITAFVYLSSTTSPLSHFEARTNTKRKLILRLHYSARSFITVGIVQSVSIGAPPRKTCAYLNQRLFGFPHVQTAHTALVCTYVCRHSSPRSLWMCDLARVLSGLAHHAVHSRGTPSRMNCNWLRDKNHKGEWLTNCICFPAEFY